MANIIQTVSKTIKNWWIPVLVGLIFIAVGVYSLMQPEITYDSVAFLFAIAFLFVGVAEIYFSISNREGLTGWGWYLVGGILLLLFGVFLLAYPQVDKVILPYFIAFMLLFRSIQGLGISFDMKSYGILSWGNVAIVSVLGILFSFLLLIYPTVNVALIVTLTGLAFIFVGIIAVVIGFNLKRIKDVPKKISKELQDRIDSLRKEVQDEVKQIQQAVKKD